MKASGISVFKSVSHNPHTRKEKDLPGLFAAFGSSFFSSTLEEAATSARAKRVELSALAVVGCSSSTSSDALGRGRSLIGKRGRRHSGLFNILSFAAGALKGFSSFKMAVSHCGSGGGGYCLLLLIVGMMMSSCFVDDDV